MVILPRCGEYGELPVGLSKDRYKLATCAPHVSILNADLHHLLK